MEEFKPQQVSQGLENKEKVNLRILYAEDYPALQKMMMLVLQERYTEVVAVSSGQELLNILNSSNYNFDLVITDNSMPPGISGVEAIRRIREKNKEILIIMMSSDDSVATAIKRSYNAYFIDKGAPRDSIYSTIENLVKDNK
jgi:CheY-like chemotaxis protein